MVSMNLANGTMARWHERYGRSAFLVPRLESMSKLTRIWEIEVRNLEDSCVPPVASAQRASGTVEAKINRK